ncbi:hypothetical protein VTL71DRAFT_7260 [Oculimacula yallundae]|uniref:Uncharacterized protein n=1 Tax=Oculimacula yallundae TaxID=86028 RepID=A0ABR4BW72_9HELO
MGRRENLKELRQRKEKYSCKKHNYEYIHNHRSYSFIHPCLHPSMTFLPRSSSTKPSKTKPSTPTNQRNPSIDASLNQPNTKTIDAIPWRSEKERRTRGARIRFAMTQINKSQFWPSCRSPVPNSPAFP